MNIFKNPVLKQILKGIILSIIYYEITKAKDTSFENIFMFTSFYIIMVNAAILIDVDPNIIVNSFITKCIFTIVDERLKKTTLDNENSKNSK